MDLVAVLTDAVASLSRIRARVLVGIDGPDAAGKTTLADRLAGASQLPTMRASIDGFHQPRERRHRRGDLSAEGYYHDSFDYPALLGNSVYLNVSPRETLRRAMSRDLDLFGSHEEIERRYLRRYLPGQELYRREVDPAALAHIVVDNNRVDAPTLERGALPGIAAATTHAHPERELGRSGSSAIPP